MMPSQNRSALFFAGLVTGGMLGAGVTLLLAPQSGPETRLRMRSKTLELKTGAVEGLTEAGRRVQEQAAAWQGKDQEVTEAVSRSKDNIVQAASQSNDRVMDAASLPGKEGEAEDMV